MFDFKNGVFTIDTTLSVADTQALNAFADTVRNGERERIIKLLEEHITYYDDEGFDVCSKCGKVYVSIENHLIALIKGEK